MAINSILNANGEHVEPSIEVRINSKEDAISAVQNSRAIHAEAVARGIGSIEFLVANGIEREVDRVVAGVFPIKVYFKLVSPLPGNFFYTIPHLKKFFEMPIKSANSSGNVTVPEKIDRRKFNRPPPRKPKVLAESPPA